MLQALLNGLREVLGGDAPLAALLLFCRLAPLVVFTPLLGGQAAPRRFRVALSLILTLVLVPVYLPHCSLPIQEGMAIPVLAKELLIGISLAVLVRILFAMLSATGALMDTARGSTMASSSDPIEHEKGTLLSVFFRFTLILIFLASGGYELLLRAFCESFATLPPGAELPPRLLGHDVAGLFASLLAQLFVIALRIAAPIMAVMLLVDAALALLNRVAPQIQVFFLGMTIKSTLALVVLALTLANVLDALRDAVPQGIYRLLGI
jgi:type III secretion protein SpaR/YscT/HrcT